MFLQNHNVYYTWCWTVQAHTLTEYYIRNSLLTLGLPLHSEKLQLFMAWIPADAGNNAFRFWLKLTWLHYVVLVDFSLILPHPLENSELIDMFMKRVWLLLCNMAHYRAGSDHQKIVNCGHEGMHIISKTTQKVCDHCLILMALKYAKKHSSHHFTTSTSLECWHKAGFVYVFIFFFIVSL